jgi:hypothetical protein
VHVDDVVELEQQLTMCRRVDLRIAEPLDDLGDRRGSREHVELERENVGAVHGFRWVGAMPYLSSVMTSGFLSPRPVIRQSIFNQGVTTNPAYIF